MIIIGGKALILFKLRVLAAILLGICFLMVSVVSSQPQLVKKNIEQADSLIQVRNSLIRRVLLDSKFSTHSIKKGENLYRLSKNYFVSLPVLQAVNQISNPAFIQEGRTLYIPPVNGDDASLQKYKIKPGDTINTLLKQYNLEMWQIKRLNPSIKFSGLREGNIIVLPKIVTPRLNISKYSLNFIRPVRGFLSSRYGFRWGRMHYGIDLAAPRGTIVKAAGIGRVSFVGWKGTYGLLIKIDHGQYCTYYGHLSKILVAKGERVPQGKIIGLVGATGRAYGSHLHFEVEKLGVKLNPCNYIEN